MPRPPARPALWLAAALVVALCAASRVAWSDAPRARVVVAVGTAKSLTHIELRGATPRKVGRDGQVVVLDFAPGQAPDVAQLHVAPPRHLQSAELRTQAGGVQLRLTPEPGAQVRTGYADGATWINLAAPVEAAAPPPAAAPDPAIGRRADPVPKSGVVRMEPRLADGALALRFAWRAPLGAAVFRRGEAVWVVFDARARLDLAAAPHRLPQARRFEAVEADGATALRIEAPADVGVSADAEGATWTVRLSLHDHGAESATAASRLALENDRDRAGLLVRMAGATMVVGLRDPAVGDRLTVVTARAPVKGLSITHDLVDARILGSVQGLAIVPRVEDLDVVADGDVVHLARKKGLALSAWTTTSRPAPRPTDANPPLAASLPGLIDFGGWSRTFDASFLARYQALQQAAAGENARDKDAPTDARFGLARFLVASRLAFEAIGVLDQLFKHDPREGEAAEFRALRGAARAMAGRYREAGADLSTPAVANDPASALWRGYASVRAGDLQGARAAFAFGRSTLSAVDPAWRGRFARADAQAALAAGDASAAEEALKFDVEESEPDERAAAKLLRARLAEAKGRLGQALALYQECAADRYGAVAAPAVLAATRLKLAQGAIDPAAASEILDSLRFRWRGDATEAEVIGELARLDMAHGRYREALDALRSAGAGAPDNPAANGLRDEMARTFRALYLDGGADGMEPVQALAMFYDFKDLTPLGADGDMMVRRLVRRLVDADLLDQASTLLKYQVDNRLEGVAKAQVATDLASVEILAARPEAALAAINGSRSTLLPIGLNQQRRFVEARALTALGRYDHALELVGADASPEALEIRGQIAWRAHDWAEAGRLADARLGERWRSAAPLSEDEAAQLVRAGSAYSLAQNDAALARLRTRYARLVDASPQGVALRVALAGLGADGAPSAGFSRILADADRFSSSITGLKLRLRDVAAPRALAPVALEAKIPPRAVTSGAVGAHSTG